MLDEVVDPDDVRVFHLGEGQSFGGSGGHGVGVAGIDQALENHPSVVHVAIDRQIDPAQSPVRDTALHLVLSAHDVAAGQLGDERISGTALAAEAFRTSRLTTAATTDRVAASRVPAEPLPFRDLRVDEDRRGRVALRNPGNRDHARAEPAPGRGGLRRPVAGGSTRALGACRGLGHRSATLRDSAAGAVPQVSQ